jgi:spore coat polysaccharide biosynthesis protein SpsF
MSTENATVAVLDLTSAVPAGSRLPSTRTRCISPFQRFQGLTVLEWCIRRLEESTLLDVVVVTGNPAQRDQVLSGSLCGARWMPSPSVSPVHRALEIAERTDAQWLVFVSATCPFLDPTLMDRLIAAAWSNPEADYVGFSASGRNPLSLGNLGLTGEMCSRPALEKLASEPADNLEVAHLIKCAPETYQMRLLPLPAELDRSEMRFNLEALEDLDEAYSLMEAAGEDISWQRLASLGYKTM